MGLAARRPVHRGPRLRLAAQHVPPPHPGRLAGWARQGDETAATVRSLQRRPSVYKGLRLALHVVVVWPGKQQAGAAVGDGAGDLGWRPKSGTLAGRHTQTRHLDPPCLTKDVTQMSLRFHSDYTEISLSCLQDTHVCHHLFSTMPHYHAQVCRAW